MVNRRSLSNLGIYVYGVGAIALGVSGLAWGDFATNWQRVQGNVPHREVLAYITALYELFGGIAILWRRTARAGAVMLTVLYSIFSLLWVPRILGSPQVYDVWANFFEEFSLVIAGVVLYTSLAPRDSTWAGRTGVTSRLYGVCVISFALEHLFYISGTASFVPKWIPPGQLFWAIATAVFFLLAAIAILSGILAGLASRLLTTMIVGFEALVWAPKLFSSPHEHFSWAGNAICLALAGAAWVVADSINESRKASTNYKKPTP
jgi:uncharacterized membrane protein YphA (DoxX/SURF4 family)